MAMVLISSNVCLMLSLGILIFVSIFSIDGKCVATLALAMITLSGSTFYSLLIILHINGLYFVFL